MGVLKRVRRKLGRVKNAPRNIDKLSRRLDAVEKDVAKLRRRTDKLELQIKTMKAEARKDRTTAIDGNRMALHDARALEFVMSDVILLKRDVGVLAEAVSPDKDTHANGDLR